MNLKCKGGSILNVKDLDFGNVEGTGMSVSKEHKREEKIKMIKKLAGLGMLVGLVVGLAGTAEVRRGVT